jgi:hypothetical protein
VHLLAQRLQGACEGVYQGPGEDPVGMLVPLPWILSILNASSIFRASTIIDIIHSGESMAKCVRDSVKDRMPVQGVCKRCGYISSMDVCKACVLLEGLNRGLPKLGVGKSSKSMAAFKALQQEDDRKEKEEEQLRSEKMNLEF